MSKIAIACLAAVLSVFAASASRAGEPSQTQENGCAPTCSHVVTKRTVVGYEDKMVRVPLYHKRKVVVKDDCCAPPPAAEVKLPEPPPKVVEVQQRVIVKYVPKIEYGPPPVVTVLQAPCAPVAVAPAPCTKCGAAIPPGTNPNELTFIGPLEGGATHWAFNNHTWTLGPKARPGQQACVRDGIVGWCG